MADDKGSSDLDVFEGLAKKGPRATMPGMVPPPSGGVRKGTLMGGIAPLPLPPPPGGGSAPLPPPPGSLPVPPGMQTRTGVPLPPPPGGASSLPMPPPNSLPMPPPVASSAMPLPPPPGAMPLPPPPGGMAPGALPPPVGAPVADPAAAAQPNKSVDMDWDDEEESTHVFDGKMPGEGGAPTAGPQRPLPAAGMPAVGAAAALLSGSGQSVRPAPLPPPPGAVPLPSAVPLPGAMGAVPPPGAVPLPSQVPMSMQQMQQMQQMPQQMQQGYGSVAQTMASPSMPLPSMPPSMQGMGGPQQGRAEATAVRHVPDLLGGMPQQQQQQASGGSKVGIILSVLALLVVVGLAVFMFLPKKGILKIDLQAKGGGAVDKAEIFVDGQKKCDITPCIVADLDPGARTVKVIVPNAGPVEPVTATVEAGKEVPVTITIDSGAGGGPATPPPVAAGGTGLKILAATPNTKVFLDGTEKGTLPTDLSDVKPGSHKLKFDAGDRYERLEQSVDVEAGKMKEVGPVKLKVLKGQIILELVTEGAEVKLINAKKVEKKIPEKEWKNQPVKIDLDPTEGWKLVATKKGMDEFSRDLAFDDGNAEKQIKIDLANPKAASGDASSGSASGSASGSITGSDSGSAGTTGSTGNSTGTSSGGSSTSTTPPTSTGTSTTDKTPPPATGNGTLNINSIPVSKIIVNGKPMGSTPKVGVSIPAGSYTVVFIHPEKGKKTASGTIKAGETKTAAVKF